MSSHTPIGIIPSDHPLPRNLPLLADRLGLTVHCSPLGYKIERLRAGDPRDSVEAWLLDLANARGARVVERDPGSNRAGPAVSESDFPNEDLVVALCQPLRVDLPQILRPAAQLISRGAVDPVKLALVARRERAEPVLRALTGQALRVEPYRPVWLALSRALADVPTPAEPILHWTRLAEPQPVNGVCRGDRWKLVS